MTGWGEAASDAYLPADMVLGQADIAVVVTDRLSSIRYVNDFAARLFRVSGDLARLAGGPVESLGLFAGDDAHQAEDLAGQVLRGRSWEGTVEAMRGDGSRTLSNVPSHDRPRSTWPATSSALRVPSPANSPRDSTGQPASRAASPETRKSPAANSLT